MPGAIDWANLGIAAAFILGAVAGTVATIRIMRVVFEEERRARARRRHDDDAD